MMMPLIRRELKQSAELGPGHKRNIDGVTWQFIRRGFCLSPLKLSI